MRYLYNPVTGELDDIVTPKLGEKYFASAESDAIIKQIFGQRNPAAEGGMMRQKYGDGAEVMTVNPLFPTKDFDSDDFQPLDVPGAIISPLAIGAGAKKLSDILFSKDEDESKEDIVERIENIEKEPDQEPPKDPFDPEKLLEILESTTYNIAENRVKNKAMNYLDKKIKERAVEIGQNKKLKEHDRRKILNNEFKELLGNQISITSSNKKGEVSYALTGGKENKNSKDLINTMNERNDIKFKKEKPFRDKGFVPTKEFIKYLQEKGVNLSSATEGRTNFEKNIKAFTNIYGIETAGSHGQGNFFVKLPNQETIDILKKKYVPLDDKIQIAKNLVEENELKSFLQINKALKMEGYKELSVENLNKYFPEVRGQHYSDKDFKYSRTPTAVLQNIRTNLIKNYGSPGMEAFLKSVKRAEGFGEAVQLMHTAPKEKRSKGLYNFEDLAFGSPEENEQYNAGLDKMRSNFTLALKTIKSDYEGKDLNQKINVPFNLREKFDFPKEMTVKKYVDRLNFMLTDLSYLTKGKVKGELLDIIGKKMKFIENPAIDYSNIPGKGLLSGQLKKYEGLFKKFKEEKNDKGKPTGRLEIDKDGYPILKEGKKLTQNQAEIILSIVEGLSTQLTSASESKPVSLKTVKDVFKQIPKASGGVIPDPEIMKYADGGRINYEDGSPRGPNEPEGDDFLNELEFNFNNIDSVTIDDTPITYDDSKSKIAQFNDLLDIRNIPYIGDMAAQAALRVGEFGARIIPATGELVADLIRKPLFKAKGAESDIYDPEGTSVMLNGEEQFLDVKQKASSYERDPTADYMDKTGKDAKFVGGAIFKNFLENITPTSTEKLVGLDTLINEEKKKMIARGDSSLMVKVGETASLGAELVAPIFPGLKILSNYFKAQSAGTPLLKGEDIASRIAKMTETEEGKIVIKQAEKLAMFEGTIIPRLTEKSAEDANKFVEMVYNEKNIFAPAKGEARYILANNDFVTPEQAAKLEKGADPIIIFEEIFGTRATVNLPNKGSVAEARKYEEFLNSSFDENGIRQDSPLFDKELLKLND